MINAHLGQLRTILCLGAHPDDIEIGCGGTILKLLAEYEPAQVHWVVLGANELRAAEARQSAEFFLGDAAETRLTIKSFRDTFFPYEGARIKEVFRELQGEVSPDVVFTCRREDMHQDHRLVAELTWNTFRDHLIFEFEIPKYEGDLGAPNIFVPLEKSVCQKKIDCITRAFQSQHEKPWFTEDTFWSLLRIRGIECNSPTGYAEGLYCRKLTI